MAGDWVLFRLAGRAGVWLGVVLAVPVLLAVSRWRLLSSVSVVLLVALVVVLPRAAVRRLTSSAAALGKMHDEHRRQEEKAQHERRELSVWVADQVSRDRLTGLLNRTAFLDRLTTVLSGPSNETVGAVLLLDLSRFSAFNEAHGPALADEMLVAVAARFASTLRPEDTVARLDGDVFGALLQAVPRDLVHDVVHRVQRAVSSTYSIGGARYTVHSVCGVVTVDPTEQLDAAELVRHAGIALQNAKATVRPVVVFEPRLEAETRERLRLYEDVGVALSNDEFTLAYQPIVHAPTDHVTGVEALMRWNHPRRGAVSPAEFIPIAEASGQIVDMGLWALRTACRQQRRWRRECELDLVVSVNLSARQLSEPDHIDHIADLVIRETHDPRSIKLEITESLVVEDNASAIDVLHRLRGLGVRLSVDDFGTGYSSLSRLSKLPIDELKIDRYFVAGIGSDGPRETILNAAVGMAHGLGLSVVAEGVETVEQLTYLKEIGCDHIQGFLYSRPLPAHQIAAFTAQRVGALLPRPRADGDDTDTTRPTPAVLPSLERPLPRRSFLR